MTTASINMSGIVTLGEQDKTLLEALGLTVPQTMPVGRMLVILKEADAIAESMENTMIQGMTRGSLAALRESLNLPATNA